MSLLNTWNKIESVENNEETAVSAIITGKNIDEDFWDNFILVCNNFDGLAELLNVSSSKVINWPARIKKFLKEAEKEDTDKINNKVLQTGDL